MRVFRESDEGHWEKDLMTFTLGTFGGLALGVLVSRALPRDIGIPEELKERARSVARRLRPARLRRLAVDQAELDRLEGRVLDAFLADSVLSERGVDIGAISHGIIEISGAVWSEEEAERAVALANGIPGVRTVVNRMEIEDLGRQRGFRRPLDEDELEGTFVHQEARVGGMGRRRQGRETDPDRPDDSQYRREDALAAADRNQWSDEDFAPRASRTNERPEAQRAGGPRFDEDELDNQDPHGKHAERTLDSPPEELNSSARVGRGLEPGTELRLERGGREE